MVSNTLRFFKIDFLLEEEFNLDIPTPARDVGVIDNLSELDWRGPYSHVTSQSFSLVHFSKIMNGDH